MPKGSKPEYPLKAFWRQVEIQPDGCWLWVGSVNRRGYGQMSFLGRTISAQRGALTILRGMSFPVGHRDVEVDHVCRNKRCVNPAHLDVVTPQENVTRGWIARTGSALKPTCKYGHPREADRRNRRCRHCARLASEAKRRLAGIKTRTEWSAQFERKVSA